MKLTVIKKREYPTNVWECVDEDGGFHMVDLINGSELKAEDIKPGMVVEVDQLFPYFELIIGKRTIQEQTANE